jgi:hypothetical protein
MTTSPTQGEHAQPEALRMALDLKAQGLEHIAVEMTRLHFENELLHAQVAAQPASPVAQAPKRLIGWRTSDYLNETADPAMAKNWEPHHDLLPIFEGDPHTKLASHGQAPATQQPAPSAAAAVGEAPLPLLVRDIAADLRTTPIQVCTALAQLGFGGHSVNMAVTPRMAKSLRAHFASPTPQADSQPAPVSANHADLPPLPDPDMRDVGTTPGGIKEFLRGYATEYAKAAIAARAPADSVTAPAGGVATGIEAAAKLLERKADDFARENGSDDLGGLSFGRGAHADAKLEYHSTLLELAEEIRSLAAAPPTQAADSVLEDAAREAIEKVLALFPFNVPIQKFAINNGPCLTADNDDEFYSVKRVLGFLTEIKTTLDAARKQGGTPAGAGEPVGYINRGMAPHTKGKVVFHEKPTENLESRWWTPDQPVFAAPQPTQAQAGAVPLTDEQMAKLYRQSAMQDRIMVRGDWEQGVRDAEAAHGIKGADHA